jgi:hypothetical protein
MGYVVVIRVGHSYDDEVKCGDITSRLAILARANECGQLRQRLHNIS